MINNIRDVLNDVPLTDFPQFKFFNKITTNENLSSKFQQTGNRLLGRVASGESLVGGPNGPIGSGFPFQTVPVPLSTLKDLRCSNQNRRFQNPELVPIPRAIVRRAFGNYVITPVDFPDNSISQLYSPPSVKPIGKNIIGTVPIAPWRCCAQLPQGNAQ